MCAIELFLRGVEEDWLGGLIVKSRVVAIWETILPITRECVSVSIQYNFQPSLFQPCREMYFGETKIFGLGSQDFDFNARSCNLLLPETTIGSILWSFPREKQTRGTRMRISAFMLALAQPFFLSS